MSEALILNSQNETRSPLIRQMPSNLIAEQMLLGTFLIDNESVNKASDFLRGEHFFDPLHQRIYDSIITFMDKGIVATPITLKNLFDQDEALKEKGGAKYLLDLASLAATIINVHDYAKTIYDLALRRKLIRIGEEVVNDAYNKEEVLSGTTQIEVAEQKLYNIANEYQESHQGFASIRYSLNEAINKAQKSFNNKGHVSGISTGFDDLDVLLGGFQDSDLFILAGRPAMGKTALAINMALNCCRVLIENFEKEKRNNPKQQEDHKPKSVGFFSLEMSADQLASRMISMISKIQTPKIRNGHLTEQEFSSIMLASQELQSIPFFIDDTPALSISAIRTRARRLKRKHNLGLLFVDYLQLVRGSNASKDSNRVSEISEITRGLKGIAKELNIPIIALSALSRAVEQREDKRPMLADLRDSGTIEQDADIVAFIFRESYYLLRKSPKEGSEEHVKWQQEMANAGNVAEVIIAKHRSGPVGDVKLYFNSALTKFGNLAEGSSQD